jgi:hypothetical protein
MPIKPIKTPRAAPHSPGLRGIAPLGSISPIATAAPKHDRSKNLGKYLHPAKKRG